MSNLLHWDLSPYALERGHGFSLDLDTKLRRVTVWYFLSPLVSSTDASLPLNYGVLGAGFHWLLVRCPLKSESFFPPLICTPNRINLRTVFSGEFPKGRVRGVARAATSELMLYEQLENDRRTCYGNSSFWPTVRDLQTQRCTVPFIGKRGSQAQQELIVIDKVTEDVTARRRTEREFPRPFLLALVVQSSAFLQHAEVPYDHPREAQVFWFLCFAQQVKLFVSTSSLVRTRREPGGQGELFPVN